MLDLMEVWNLSKKVNCRLVYDDRHKINSQDEARRWKGCKVVHAVRVNFSEGDCLLRGNRASKKAL